MVPPPTSLDDLLEQRDEEMAERIDRLRKDVRDMSSDLSNGNMMAARYMLVAIDAELSIMRGMLP